MNEYKAPAFRDIYKLRAAWFKSRKYEYKFYNEFDYSVLRRIMWRRFRGMKDGTINDVLIMADTETSKTGAADDLNIIVAWTISLRAFGCNICTLYGRRPGEFIECINSILAEMPGLKTIIYFHNLSYDYVFLRKFFYRAWGFPLRCLNTKSHYPINMEFENGLCIRDSLILAQRSLEKWAADMGAEHQKAVGSWDYSKIRTQLTPLDPAELEYIEHDTLAGVECIDALLNHLNKDISSIPYTATGIPREQVRKLGKENRARERFLKMAMNYTDYRFSETVYHGGYVHANRHEIGWINPATCYDFASSYPFVMLAYKYPMEAFFYIGTMPLDEIIKLSEDYAFMLQLVLIDPRLKSDDLPMPALQSSKALQTINEICDNGRILKADAVVINITEQDLAVILAQYAYSDIACLQVRAARKKYLPRWFTDYVFECFKNKTMLKGGDPVAYAMAKAVVNSLYGMCVQKSIREDLQENYLDWTDDDGNDHIQGEYESTGQDPEVLYQNYLDNKNSILPYQWGVWVTAYAFRNLFKLGSCVASDGIWLYSDTDSCYATKWDTDKIKAYNDHCKELLQANGYGPVIRNGREYWLGVAELDGEYSEFVSMGAKRYCCRDAETGELKITVAGVPKKGAACLNDDIKNFTKGFIFDGKTTGKLTHRYFYKEEITDYHGNETGDYIDLTPCDYLLDQVNAVNWDDIETEEITLQVYDENFII